MGVRVNISIKEWKRVKRKPREDPDSLPEPGREVIAKKSIRWVAPYCFLAGAYIVYGRAWPFPCCLFANSAILGCCILCGRLAAAPPGTDGKAFKSKVSLDTTDIIDVGRGKACDGSGGTGG